MTENPKTRDIIKFHGVYYKNVGETNFDGDVLVYITPVSELVYSSLCPKNNDYSIICSITAHQSLFFSQWGTDVPLTIILVGKLWVGLDGGWREGGRLWVPLEHCKVLQQMDGGGRGACSIWMGVGGFRAV